MSAVEKVKKKKGGKGTSKNAPKAGKGGDVKPAPSNQDDGEESIPLGEMDKTMSGSFISVREATEGDKADSVENVKVENDTTDSATRSRPSSANVGQGSNGPRPSSAVSTHTLSPPPPVSRPSSARSQVAPSGSPVSQRSNRVNSIAPIGNPEGSQVSLRSREAWTVGSELAGNPNASRPMSAVSKKSVNSSVMNLDKAIVKPPVKDNQTSSALVPAEMNKSHAYVPYMYARDCISKIVEDMKNMKQGHIHIVHDIENNYKAIEDETQAQFNAFVWSLRQQYKQKVKTFRQVIEVHRIELDQRQQYWDEALVSLGGRNTQLLQDKKRLLIQNKLEFERLDKEKKNCYGELTAKVDDANVVLVNTKKEYEERLKEQQTRHEEERKVVEDELQAEKKENEKLLQRIEELEVTESVVAATAAASRSERPGSSVSRDSRQLGGTSAVVIVSDLSEEDRKRLAREEARIASERNQISAERSNIEDERRQFAEERSKFQEERVVLQGDLNSSKRSQEEWRVRYVALRNQLGDLSELRAKYEALQALFTVVASFAVVSTPEERKKIEDKIAKTEEDRQLMFEEKHGMEEDIKKWEREFKSKKGFEPTENDRPDSIHEQYTSLAEANTMVENLDIQIVALQSLKNGQVPQPPKVEPRPIDIKEPEVISVEVKVPDPDVQAELEKCQAEVMRLKTEQTHLHEDQAKLQSQIASLESEHLDLRAEIARLEASNKALETELARVGVVSQKGVDEAELQRALAEREKEYERHMRDQQHEFENQLREKEREKREVERDIKKLLKQQAKQQKSQDNERVKQLLQVVISQAKGVNGEVNEASEKVSDRLTKAEGQNISDQEKTSDAESHYKKWEAGFMQKHGQPPTPQERDSDKNGKKLYEDYSAAQKGSGETDLLVTALQMIHTGVVPDKLQPKNASETDKLERRLSELEDQIQELEDKLAESQADNKQLQDKNNDQEEDIEQLRRELAEAREQLDAGMGVSATVTVATTGEMAEMTALKNKIQELEKSVWDKEKAMKEKDNAHLEELKVKEREKKEMERDIKKMIKQMDKYKKEKGGTPMTTDQDKAALEEEVEALEDKVSRLEEQVSELEQDKDRLKEDNKELEQKLQEARSGIGVSAAVVSSDDGVEDLSRQISHLQRQVDEVETALQKEKSAHDDTREELESVQKQLSADEDEMDDAMAAAQAKLDGATTKFQADIDNLKKKLAEAEARVEELEKERMKNIPVDTAKEISTLKAKLAAVNKEKDSVSAEKANLAGEVKQLQAQLASAEKASKSQKANNSDSEAKLKQLRKEKDKEIKSLTAAAEKKEQERAKQEQKKVAALEKKIRDLEVAVAAGGGAGRPTNAKPDAKGGDKAMQEQLRVAKQDNRELQQRIKHLEMDLKESRSKSGAGAADSDKLQKKHEKILKELQKKLDIEMSKNEKNEKNLKQKEDQLKAANKDISAMEEEIKKLKTELAELGLAAEEGVAAATKLKDLEKEVKSLKKENKELAENFNSERVLRKKYYNMVEDMKGKIRVYCRVRPMSKSELGRGNHSVCKSPDEYTIQVGSARGQKDFQFDSIFMPESSQERVFEDTNNLIQSAVDGYNVCIFAYGQTGSGKTFTIIGDREQNFPGIAPRAFNRIYELLDENKKKFAYKVNCYMLELYNDRLLDLFSKGGNEDKMEIKKDKKGMVFIQGSEVKVAKNAKELYALFEEGSKTRHVASTNMNAESSRSHLVIGIIIETTNKATGQVMKGKLSLVDLAGSERAAKTGATAEQLKEAMSINKSLSALGDVISALSSEQSFIPYRNNKLTMLMQDSLGGNAKTLMFVNVSPADYNSDETVVSLTYASRVKLITNDASKNADNKEIARLKSVIAKLKSGEAVQEEED